MNLFNAENKAWLLFWSFFKKGGKLEKVYPS